MSIARGIDYVDLNLHLSEYQKYVTAASTIQRAWKRREKFRPKKSRLSIESSMIKTCVATLHLSTRMNIFGAIFEEDIKQNSAALVLQSFFREKRGSIDGIPRAARARCLATASTTCPDLASQSRLYEKALSIARGKQNETVSELNFPTHSDMNNNGVHRISFENAQARFTNSFACAQRRGVCEILE